MTMTRHPVAQSPAQKQFLMAVKALALCGTTVLLASCAQDPMVGSVASGAVSDSHLADGDRGLRTSGRTSPVAQSTQVNPKYPGPSISGGFR